jgi:hypothetical protein
MVEVKIQALSGNELLTCSTKQAGLKVRLYTHIEVLG